MPMMARNRCEPRRFPALLAVPLALLALVVATPLRAAESGSDASPALTVERVSVTPVRAHADSLLGLSVRLANTGSKPASRLRFRVTVDGVELVNYRDLLDLRTVPAGDTAELRLYNLWASESSRPLTPEDGELTVSVELVAASWIEIVEGESDAPPAQVPVGEVGGLPSRATATVALAPAGGGGR